MRRKSLKTRERALEIPKLAKIILLVNQKVNVFFSHLTNIGNLKAHQKDLRNQLFYIERTLSGQFESLPHQISDQIRKMAIGSYLKGRK